MKKLHLIRHAKSSWADPNLSDVQRPLNRRGETSCEIMAPAVAAAGCGFEHVFCSPAQRAQSTAECFAKVLPDMAIQWQTDEQLYTFNGANLLHWCQAIDDALDEVVLFGHNPAITDLCNGLTGADVENIPTCGYALLTFEGDSWSELKPKAANLELFLTPKKVADN